MGLELGVAVGVVKGGGDGEMEGAAAGRGRGGRGRADRESGECLVLGDAGRRMAWFKELNNATCFRHIVPIDPFLT